MSLLKPNEMASQKMNYGGTDTIQAVSHWINTLRPSDAYMRR